MGNTLGRKQTTKVMKINGKTMKLKTPVRAREIVKDYLGYVLLESEAVKHFGIHAKPLEVYQELKPKRLYFFVELPKVVEEKGPRRVWSGINMSAKDRLESLMLAWRSVSDLSMMRSTSIVLEESNERSKVGAVRVKMRVPKAEVAKLMMEIKDEAEVAERIVGFCLANKANNGNGGGTSGTDGSGNGDAPPRGCEGSLLHQQVHWKDGLKAREDEKTGNWWFVFTDDNRFVGYWPKELFPHLAGGAPIVAYGGRAQGVVNHLSPPMGSGLIPDDSARRFYHACFFANVQFVNIQHELFDPNGITRSFNDRSGCYGLQNYGETKDMGYAFLFGGPGGHCGN